MSRRLFYRNIQANESLDAFLLSAITSLLLVRFYLELTNYPQISGGGLHIAHMLWGGLFMMMSVVMLVSFIGSRVQRFAVILGGAGFGVFIDELGKFITSDNNYFFQPTIGLIYAIFVVMYLIFNFLSRKHVELSSREYQLNALRHMEEAIVQDLDEHEKRRAEQLLARANQKSPITKQLQAFFRSVDAVRPGRPSLLARAIQWLDNKYIQFWRSQGSTWQARAFFLAQGVLFLIAVLYTTWGNLDEAADVFRGLGDYSKVLLVGELASAFAAALFVVRGAWQLPRDRVRALEQFRRSAYINLFLTQFFVFAREELSALPGFLLNLGVLGIITYALNHEYNNRASGRG